MFTRRPNASVINRAARDPNLTDTNGAPGAMDEDGELDEEIVPHTMGEDDVSPVMQALAMKTEHLPGQKQPQTTITANIFVSAQHQDEEESYEELDKKSKKMVTKTRTVSKVIWPGGVQSKRMVIPGGVTAQKLAAMLVDVANW